jgi:F0F1-type ATP synthase assembly protein I
MGMDATEVTSETKADSPVSASAPAKKSAHKINLYVAFLILVGVGVGGFIDMSASVAFPLLSIAILLTVKFTLDELKDIRSHLPPH